MNEYVLKIEYAQKLRALRAKKDVLELFYQKNLRMKRPQATLLFLHLHENSPIYSTFRIATSSIGILINSQNMLQTERNSAEDVKMREITCIQLYILFTLLNKNTELPRGSVPKVRDILMVMYRLVHTSDCRIR